MAESTLCLLAFFVEKVVLDDLLQGGALLPPVKDQQISQPWCGEGLALAGLSLEEVDAKEPQWWSPGALAAATLDPVKGI